MTLIQHTTASLLPQALLFGRPQSPAVVATPAPALPSALEKIAAQRGFPATFDGYTPNERYYWQERGLPFMGACPNTVADLEAYRVSREGTYNVLIPEGDERMAPRFLGGTFLAARRVLRKQDITPGIYVWDWEQEGQCYSNMGRLQHVRRGRLELMHDLDQQPVGCRLQWSNPTFRLYKVIGYNSQPSV